jgi:hypothetical protein
MPLRESKGNMYSWVTHTWNTVKGECPHGCSYCYMKRWGKQKSIRFDEKELQTHLGANNVIFIGSSCDMFAKQIPVEWILETVHYARLFANINLYQTKFPERFYFLRNEFNDTDRFCTTIETNRRYDDIMGKTSDPHNRAYYLGEMPFNRYLTIEPIMDFDLHDLITLVKIVNPVQVNIGADSGNNNLPEPSKEKLLALIYELQKFTVIDKKNNLNRLLK